jgi:NADPH2:quinone reductase
MRAIWLREYGPPGVLVVEEMPVPVPQGGQALIEVALANITFVETQVRAGTAPFPTEIPMIPGNGVGGTVRAVGPGVDDGLLGRRVITSTGGSGGYAEFVTVDAGGLIEVPDTMVLDDAVALLADGRTATMLIATAALQRDDRVLVEAAAGGVGSLRVQLARSAGATVIAAVGDARKVEVARGLGADVVVNYRDADWTARVRDEVGQINVVFDGVGGEIARSAFDLLERGGRMVRFGAASGEWAPISDEMAADHAVTLLSIPRPTPQQAREYTEHALAEAAAGRLRPLIGQRFPLEGAADAHAAIESRASVGKTLLANNRELA